MKQAKHLFFIFLLVATVGTQAQVGIGTPTPAAKLDIRGVTSNPSIPGLTSTGVLRIGVSSNEGIDIGKMALTPFSGWIQSGFAGTTADPLALQPNGGAVGIGTTSPHVSAVLDLTSTTQGFLPPRMTSAQRDALNPAEGLMIYNTTSKKPNFFDGTEWKIFDGTTVRAIGENYKGGIIAYILLPGDPGYVAGQTHGLIAAASDQSTGAQWGCQGTLIPGADGTALGTGNQNTIDIMAGCATAGIAARICGDLVLNSFSDWYLPSKDELDKLYLNRLAVGGFSTVSYWSSSEYDNQFAWKQWFDIGTQVIEDKNYAIVRVRAVRAF